MAKSTAVTLPNAQRIGTRGKWEYGTFRSINGKRAVYVSDGWIVDYPIRYHTGKLGYDMPERIPASVRERVNKHVRYEA